MDNTPRSSGLRIAVAGGTGTVGRHVVEVAQRRGHQAVVLARSTGVDLVAGTGVDEALEGVQVVVDVTSHVSQKAEESRAFFGAVTRNLLAAESRAGIGHHVALSIVGIDEAPHGYYAGKVLQEELLARSTVPWTVLRATQFHEFAAQMLGDGPVAVIPSMLSQPVAAQDVADELVRLVTAPAAGMAPELAGPQQERIPDMARRLASARDRRPLVIVLPLPGSTGRGMRTGALLPTGPGPRGTQTFEEWLQDQTVRSSPTNEGNR